MRKNHQSQIIWWQHWKCYQNTYSTKKIYLKWSKIKTKRLRCHNNTTLMNNDFLTQSWHRMDKKKKKRHTKQLCKRRYDSSRCRPRPCLRATDAAFAAKKCVDKVCRRTLQISVTNLRLLARPPLNGSFFLLSKYYEKQKTSKSYSSILQNTTIYLAYELHTYVLQTTMSNKKKQ